MKILKWVVLAFAALLIGTMAWITWGLLQEKKAAMEKILNLPNFTFYHLSGEAFTQDDVPTDKNIVFLYFSPTCEHCQEETLGITQRINELQDAEIYMVSIDPITLVAPFVAEMGLDQHPNLTVLLDSDNQFTPSFALSKIPSTLIYGPGQSFKSNYEGSVKVQVIIDEVNRKE